MSAVVFGLVRRLRLPALTEAHDSTLVLGLFAFANGLIAIGAMAFVAFVTGEPFVFPSLGPTAFLLFYTPLLPAASPRNTLGGHLIGAAAGYLALVVFGLADAPPALASGVTAARVGAAALSLGLTSGAMV
jgi:CBS domain-containing membrane protein